MYRCVPQRLAVVLTLFLCSPAITACMDAGIVTGYGVPGDVQDALDSLPRVDGVDVGADGLPVFVRGDLGRAARAGDVAEAQAALAPALVQIAPVFRLRAADLTAFAVHNDTLGMTHVKYRQRKDGLDVIGGELIVHVGADGVVELVQSTARGDALSATPTITAAGAATRARELTPAIGASAGQARLLFVIASADGVMHLAYETRVTGVEDDGTPVDDLVYVDAHTGALADRHPTIHTAKNRKVYDSGGGTSLPGTLRRSEGSAAGADTVVNGAYDNTGITYDCYKTLFNRDSFNNGGATLSSTVHYDQNYVNAYWNGSQMVFGDGDGSTSAPLAKSLDITAHELTHAVTQYEGNMVYQNEPGALNEGWSDIMSAVCESWSGGGVTANTWKLGEAVWTPGTAGDALRYMDNPTADGYSRDYYPERLTGSGDNGGVHGNSGIANLAFKLTVTGGTHPRGKTSINVPGLGMDQAGQIYYRALSVYMSSNTNFAGARTATATAANDLYGANAKYSVEAAWYAVGVGSQPTPPGGGGDPPPPPPPPPSGDTPLTSGVAVTGLSGAVGANLYYKIDVAAGAATTLSFVMSGGSGDADIYVKKGARPTSTVYDARPYLNGNNETVTLDPSAGGTWYVMINAYTAFSGVQLVATASGGGGGGGGGGNVLVNGTPVPNLSAPKGTMLSYKIDVPAGATNLKFTIAGGTGDADMYVRRGAAPTTTTYDYRPYLNGNAETVTVAAPQAATWYVSVRAYAAFSGVTLTASYTP